MSQPVFALLALLSIALALLIIVSIKYRRYKKSEARFRRLSEAATEAVILHDGKKVIDANAAAIEIIGYTRKEILEKSLLDFAAPESHQSIIEQIKSGNSVPYEVVALRKGGARFHAELIGKTIELQGKPVRVVVLRDLTERKAEREALRSSEERFSKAFKASPDAITISTMKEGKFIEVNEGFTRISGYSREEAIGTSSEQLKLWVNLDDRQRMIALLQREGRMSNLEARIRSKSGDALHCVISAEVIEIDGEPCLVGITRDITAEKQSSNELEQSRAMLQVILDSIPVRVFWKDRESRYMGCNALFASDAGLTPAEIVGKDDYGMVWKKQAGLFQHSDQNVLTTGNAKLNYEEEMTIAENKNLWLRTSKVPLRDRNGRLIGLMGCYEDITSQKEAIDALRKSESALRESESRFRALAESTSAVIMIFRGEDLLYVNPAGQQLIGYSLEKMEKMKFWEVIHPDHRDLVIQRGTMRQQGANVPSRYEVKVITASAEEKWVEFSGRVIDFQGSPAVIGTAVDITERKLADVKIRRLNEELERRVKARTSALEASNRELESFGYSVSHDLRAPLRAIQGYAGILMEDHAPSLGGEAQRLLRVIQANTSKMGGLIDDLLAFSRLGRSHMAMESIDMTALAQEVVHELTFLLEKKPAVHIDHLAGSYGDRAMIRQVWVNLIANAVKFSSKDDNPRIEIRSEVYKDEISYSVKDNGVGFDMEYAKKLFGVFQRLHREDEFPGTGVGLALVQRIIQRHNGRVWAKGIVGEGATFFFAVPASHSDDR